MINIVSYVRAADNVQTWSIRAENKINQILSKSEEWQNSTKSDIEVQ